MCLGFYVSDFMWRLLCQNVPPRKTVLAAQSYLNSPTKVALPPECTPHPAGCGSPGGFSRCHIPPCLCCSRGLLGPASVILLVQVQTDLGRQYETRKGDKISALLLSLVLPPPHLFLPLPTTFHLPLPPTLTYWCRCFCCGHCHAAAAAHRWQKRSSCMECHIILRQTKATRTQVLAGMAPPQR